MLGGTKDESTVLYSSFMQDSVDDVQELLLNINMFVFETLPRVCDMYIFRNGAFVCFQRMALQPATSWTGRRRVEFGG